MNAQKNARQYPVFLDVKGIFPYTLGYSYVANTYCAAFNWTSVNNLYSISMIPKSSAEINQGTAFTPSYFEFNTVKSLLASMSPQIVFTDDDNGGFNLLLGLFYGDLEPNRLDRSLDWRGDRYMFVMRSNQTFGTLVWALDFTSADAAKYVFSKLDKLIKTRVIGGKSPYYSSIDSVADSLGQGITYTYTSSLFTTTLKRSSNQIWWLENTDSLTKPIMDILAKAQPQPALAKTSAKTLLLPLSLSPVGKHTIVKGILRHLFNKQNIKF